MASGEKANPPRFQGSPGARPDWRQFWRVEPRERIPPGRDLHQPRMPGFDARKILNRQAGEVRERQDAGDAEIGVGDGIADEPVRRAETLLQNGRRGCKFIQPRFDNVLPHRADAIALLGHALEMDPVAGADEIPIAD